MKEMCEAYLEALNEGNLDKVLALFTENAMVHSPLYGKVPAADFYRELFADTRQSETTLLHVFDRAEPDDSVALHFHYRWTLQGGRVVEFECVDVFGISRGDGRFESLRIIYDTHPLRHEHANVRGGKNR